jgi:hypothetical protein
VERLSSADRQKIFFKLDRINNNHGRIISKNTEAQLSYLRQNSRTELGQYGCTELSRFLQGGDNAPQVSAFAKKIAGIKICELCSMISLKSRFPAMPGGKLALIGEMRMEDFQMLLSFLMGL